LCDKSPSDKAQWEAGKAEDEMTAAPQNRAKVVHFSLNSPPRVACSG
jgi:hypothetical protein